MSLANTDEEKQYLLLPFHNPLNVVVQSVAVVSSEM
jgi:hypothetical protein